MKLAMLGKIWNPRRQELIRQLSAALGITDAGEAESLLDRYCELDAPDLRFDKRGMVSLLMGWFAIVTPVVKVESYGKSGGYSIKPGNLTINLKDVIKDIPEVVLTAAGVAATHWLIPLAILSLCNKTITHLTVNLGKEHVCCLSAMWFRRGIGNKIGKREGYDEASRLFRSHGWPELSREGFNSLIEDLERMKCLKDEGEVVWLCEKVVIEL